MADYSILQPMPNFTQAALSGYQAGTAIRKQKQVDQALQGIDLDKPETLLPILRADPATGAALIGASTKLAAEKRDIDSRNAMGAYLKSLPQFGGGGSGGVFSQGSSLAGPGMIPSQSEINTNTDAASSGASVSDGTGPSQVEGDGTIVVQGSAEPTPEQLRNAAIGADPQGFMEMQKQISALSDAQMKRVASASDAFSDFGAALLNVPYAQRGAYIQANAGDLIAHGVPPEKIASFDPTDSNIQLEMGKAIGVKGMVDQRNKDREYSLNLNKFGEEQRHNRATEGNAAGNLAVAQGNLGMRAKELAQKGAGSPTATGGPIKRVINGRTFYNVGGKWYDNPEGR